MTEQQIIGGLIVIAGAALAGSLLRKRDTALRADTTSTRVSTNRIRWRDHTLEVKARGVPRYLYFTASIDVHLDSTALIKTGGVPRFKGLTEAKFDEQGETHSITLSWSSSIRGLALPYQLLVDGEVVLQSRVRPQNWAVGLISALIIATLWSLISWAVRH